MNDDYWTYRSDYQPHWVCNECGSSNVQTMTDAWFDPNDNFRFIESVEAGNGYDWCNDCNGETTFDEAEPKDDPWGHAYGDPLFWVPPIDDEYWQVRGDCQKQWTVWDEKEYWRNRLGVTNAND